MGKIKSNLAMLTLGAMAMRMGNNRRWGGVDTEPKETKEEREKRLKQAEIERYKRQGLTQFFYGENSLWALNQKSADRKAKKNNWL